MILFKISPNDGIFLIAPQQIAHDIETKKEEKRTWKDKHNYISIIKDAAQKLTFFPRLIKFTE